LRLSTDTGWKPGTVLGGSSSGSDLQGLGAESDAGCGLPPRTHVLKRIALLDFGQALRLTGTGGVARFEDSAY